MWGRVERGGGGGKKGGEGWGAEANGPFFFLPFKKGGEQKGKKEREKRGKNSRTHDWETLQKKGKGGGRGRRDGFVIRFFLLGSPNKKK